MCSALSFLIFAVLGCLPYVYGWDAVQGTDNRCPHTTYIVSSQIRNVMQENYRSCYDLTTQTSKYTLHTVYPGTRTCPATRSWNNYPLNVNIGNSYRQSHINTVTYNGFPIYHRGHLTTCADFSYPNQRSSTNLYINAVPQLRTLNIGDWKSLETFIRNSAPQSGATVATGGLGVLINMNTNNPIYLYGNNGLPIPKWIYKIVKWTIGNQRTLYAFLAHNFNIAPTANEIASVCTRLNNCPKAAPIICCDPAHFIRTNVPNLATTF